MGRLAFTRNDLAAYDLLSRAGSDIKSGMMQYGLSKAADVKPETIDETRLQETTQGTEGMVYDSDTGQYLPRYLGADGQPTENAATQQGDVAGTEPVDGVRPTFDAKTVKQYRLGERTQDTPFNEDQVQAERYRRQAGVLTKLGMPDKAAQVSALARTTEDQGVTDAIRQAGANGLKSTTQAMREEEKQLSMTKAMYDEAIRLRRYDLASQLYAQFDQARTGAMKRATDRAESVRRNTISKDRPNGSISGYVDAQNRYVSNGLTIPDYKENSDGSIWLNIRDDFSGKSHEVTVPPDRVEDYLMTLTDLDRVRAIEQKRGEIAFKARTDAQEAMNKPMMVGKDQTVVIPATGQTFSPRGANATIDPKEYNGVLDDINKMFLERSRNFDQATGKWNYSPDAVKESSLGQRLFVGNPSLTPAQVVEIVDNGQSGTWEVDIDGRRQRVPAINYGGRTFLLGGNEAGMPQPAVPTTPSAAGNPAAPAPTSPAAPTTAPAPMSKWDALTNTKQLVPRETSGKIQQPAPQGLQRRVSSNQQAARDAEAKAIILRELAGDMPEANRAAAEREFRNRFGERPPSRDEAIRMLLSSTETG